MIIKRSVKNKSENGLTCWRCKWGERLDAAEEGKSLAVALRTPESCERSSAMGSIDSRDDGEKNPLLTLLLDFRNGNMVTLFQLFTSLFQKYLCYLEASEPK